MRSRYSVVRDSLIGVPSILVRKAVRGVVAPHRVAMWLDQDLVEPGSDVEDSLLRFRILALRLFRHLSHFIDHGDLLKFTMR